MKINKKERRNIYSWSIKSGHLNKSAFTKIIVTHPKSFQLSFGYFKKLILTGKNPKYITAAAKLN